jgi:predicted MPP superfamily phosphohydrolase
MKDILNRRSDFFQDRRGNTYGLFYTHGRSSAANYLDQYYGKMIIFLFFHGTYGLAHLYIFFKVKGVFPLDTAGSVLLGLFLLYMALSPMVTYIFTLRGGGPYTRVSAFFGYMWMGFLILFFSSLIFLDLYNLCIKLSGFIFLRDMSTFMLSPFYSFFIPVFISSGLTIYGYFGAKDLRVRRLTVRTPKLPEDIKRVRIAHISDVHLGVIVRDKILDKLIKKVNSENPDMIVSTGDLIDGGLKQIRYLIDKLRSMNARLGKFTVIGNHEFYSGIKSSQEFLEDSGFTVLRGCGVTVKGLINIAGVDDSEGGVYKESKNSVLKSEREVLSELPLDRFTLLLKHKPEVDTDSLGLFDLQLSGHTHRGQIFPINLAVRFFFYPHSSYKELSRGSAISVSGGVGTAGPPVRLFSPPEITIIEIVQGSDRAEYDKEKGKNEK